jgi:hypothetical protein
MTLSSAGLAARGTRRGCVRCGVGIFKAASFGRGSVGDQVGIFKPAPFGHGSDKNKAETTLGSAGLAARATRRGCVRRGVGVFKAASFGRGSVGAARDRRKAEMTLGSAGLAARATCCGSVGVAISISSVGDMRAVGTASGRCKPAPFGHGSVKDKAEMTLGSTGLATRATCHGSVGEARDTLENSDQ